MKKEIVKTTDGSHTIFVPELEEHYHSTHGAVQESLHVFIKSGMQYQYKTQHLSILEIGFGTGLNALLTKVESERTGRTVDYTTIEAFPLSWEMVKKMNYTEVIDSPTQQKGFEKMHLCDWDSYQKISEHFKLRKQEVKLQDVSYNEEFNLIYFDAFSPNVQPELWTEDIFESMYKSLKPNGVLVTYCAKGSVKRALKSSGFTLESIPGPPGKREMSRGLKL